MRLIMFVDKCESRVMNQKKVNAKTRRLKRREGRLKCLLKKGGNREVMFRKSYIALPVRLSL